MILMKFPTLLLVCLISVLQPLNGAELPDKDQAALNRVYVMFNRAFNELDTSPLENIYAEDATYIPEQQSLAIVQGRENVLKLYQKFFDRIRHKQARIEVDFRLQKRQVHGKSATDIGYYLVRFYPPKDTEEPMSEFAGKIVIVSHKDQKGNWLVDLDTSNRAEPEHYFNAKPQTNLYYGEQFAPEAPISVEIETRHAE
ncbi:hypothetical protein TUM17387_18640 [Shewanella carassii]|uniref:DUF4440 domain-containing protein n=2 Tax=Shewanella carassii TaxID=1987584 RepID=A0ABQ1SV98_9GAMM|nr:hypothetical protein TUM17387_18640 [Shewanella carassii]GGE66680.1 hypothetical protein GCM10011520_04330 [Shewanella carassii]